MTAATTTRAHSPMATSRHYLRDHHTNVLLAVFLAVRLPVLFWERCAIRNVLHRSRLASIHKHYRSCSYSINTFSLWHEPSLDVQVPRTMLDNLNDLGSSHAPPLSTMLQPVAPSLHHSRRNPTTEGKSLRRPCLLRRTVGPGFQKYSILAPYVEANNMPT